MLRRLQRDDAGLAAVEFALIAPVMVLLICGSMELAYVFSARSALESATMRGARAIAASDCPTKRDALLKTIIENGMTGFNSADGKEPTIESRAYSGRFGDVREPEPFDDENDNKRYDLGEPFADINGNGQWDPDMGRLGSIGAAGQVVSYTTRYQVVSLFPFVSGALMGKNSYDIEATTVIRNEPIFRTGGC